MPAHGNSPIDTGILFELKSGVEGILSGELIGIHHKTFIGSGMLCKLDNCGVLYKNGMDEHDTG